MSGAASVSTDCHFLELFVNLFFWTKKLIAGPLIIAAVFLPVRVSAQDKNLIEPAAVPTNQFGKLHMLIKPQPGELRFHEIPWLLDIWETRKKAAAEGKPILVWAGSGGAPIGGC